MAEQGVFDNRILLQIAIIDAQGLQQSKLPFSGRSNTSKPILQGYYFGRPAPLEALERFFLPVA